MKSIIYILLALPLLVGCQEDEWSSSKQQEIRVTASFSATRTIFTEDNDVTHVSWEKNDCITICTEKQNALWYEAKENGREVEFLTRGERLQAAEGDSVYARTGGESADGNPFHISIYSKESQFYEEEITKHDFLYAANKVENGNVTFRFKHLYAFLKITFPHELVFGKSMRNLHQMVIESSEAISGRGYLDLQKGNFIPEATSNHITYFLPDTIQATEITCYIAMLPQSENANIKIYLNTIDSKDCLTAKKTPKGGFKAGNVYTLYLSENETEIQRQQEREALIALYKATNGDNWTRKDNWCSEKPVGEWEGVLTDEYGQVYSLMLRGNNLDGMIPPEVCYLTQLRTLHLSMNKLKGKIPEEFTNLTQLEDLELEGNELEGSFPDLTFLKPASGKSWIHIQDNKFTGKMPELPDPQVCYVGDFWASNNMFTGPIPENHLKYLQQPITEVAPYGFNYDVSHNNLSGKLADEIARHENFHLYWFNILPQNQGYGFDQVDIPAHANTVKCYDGTFVNMKEEFQKNKYTILFRWDPNCPFSAPYPPKFESLRQKYQKRGLGILGMTQPKFSDKEMSAFTNEMPETKIFWEGNTLGNVIGLENEYENNPYHIGRYIWLYRFGGTPLFFVVDKQGNIVFFGSCEPWEVTNGTIPQYHENRDDIFNFVANLFGDPEFVPEEQETDYSHDGKVVTLQTATVNKGIDLVFMGEGFRDIDMEPEGKYEQKMKEAMEQYFAYEPYKTFRNRFNCYAVKVVTPNNKYLRLQENDNVCIEYAQKVPNINTDRWHISVIYNSSYAGRSYTRMYSDGTFVAYIMQEIDEVLNHETGGHGFAKLLDEYIEPGNESLSLPKEGQETLDWGWNYYGWGANVDYQSSPAEIRWAHLLDDPRYKDEVGIYEGSYLYGFGAYRPSENSMMRYNTPWFNAPSREAIYKAIMRESEGESWVYNYEDFVTYDAINRGTPPVTRTISPADIDRHKKNHRPPVIIKGTWRDAMKNRVKVPFR